MKKKELLKLIVELQSKMAILETKIALLQPQIIGVPSIITSPGTTLPSVVSTCQHEYENPWFGITPPCCKKCGVPAHQMTFTCGDVVVGSGGINSNISGSTSTDILQSHIQEYIQKNTKN